MTKRNFGGKAETLIKQEAERFADKETKKPLFGGFTYFVLAVRTGLGINL